MVFDRIKDFFIKKILLPNVFRIDVPGYVIGKFYTLEGQNVFERDFVVPEDFFVYLENDVVAAMGKVGKQKLYTVGKQFGWRYSEQLYLPKHDPVESANLTFKFLETLYASKIETSISLKEKMLSLSTSNLVITRKNGMGYSLTIGGSCGVWAYLLGDYSIECAVKKISNNEYLIVSGPKALLEKNGFEVMVCNALPSPLHENYRKFNSPTQNMPSTFFSIKKLLDANFFYYNEGALSVSKTDFRLLPFEISLLYSIYGFFPETLLSTPCFKSFSDLGKSLPSASSPTFACNVFSSLGFGLVDVVVTKNIWKFTFTGFPWVSPKSNVAAVFFAKHFLSGFLSGNLNKKISVKETSNSLSENKLIVSISIEVP